MQGIISQPGEGGNAMEPEVRQSAQAPDKKITEESVREADTIMQRYRAGKRYLEERIVENERWAKLRQWDVMGVSSQPNDPRPSSAWLLNSLHNAHADAMDNVPSPNILPREEGDRQEAKILSSVIPVVLEQNDAETAYSNIVWDKLKNGTGVWSVFWDNTKGGLGDIGIRRVNLLNLFWDPAIIDIQDSPNFFHAEMVPREDLVSMYPDMDFASRAGYLTEYLHDEAIDYTDYIMVVDWYYKRRRADGAAVLHLCKYCNGQVLFSTENEPDRYPNGWYDHGRYPYVFDVMYPMADSACGYGKVDIAKDPQMYIDALQRNILKHSLMATSPRYFIRGDSTINEQEFVDWSKPFIHVEGGINSLSDSIDQLRVDQLPSIYYNVLQFKVDELKETSGNRDFNQGGTSSGVTSGAAIAALQEAGSKLHRDFIKTSYRAYRDVCYLVLELIRQFYTEQREFRITGDDRSEQFVSFDNSGMQAQPVVNTLGVPMGGRVPIYDIKIVAQKSSPVSTAVQNERAKELYSAGFFAPENATVALTALDMMDFEGIARVRQKISENGTLYDQLQQMRQQMAQLAQIVDRQNGTNIAGSIASQVGNAGKQTGGTLGAEPQSDPYGSLKQTALSSVAQATKDRVAASAAPGGR